jgi:predicted SAM-dependent methyltransferase
MKLHLGCGKRYFGEDWIHIDKSNYDYIKYNDVKNLPFQDNTVDIIYNCGLIPYFDNDEIKLVLNEWNRVLKKNGVLRIATPDFEIMSSLYSQKKYPLQNFIGPIYGKWPISENEYIYQRNTYDMTKLTQLLKNANFKSIEKYEWRDTEHSRIDDYSQAYLPHMDKDNGVLISLNVQCKKN